MNKFVTSALALSVAGSLAHAGTGDGEWLELDREIASLATPVMSPAQGGINWSALLRVNHYYSDDFQVGAEDTSGVSFQDIDLAATGQVGDYSWRISGDFDLSVLVLEDAYASWNMEDYFSLRFGNQKPAFLRSQMVSPENLLFTNRTALGSVFDGWDAGVSAMGSFENMIRYSVAVMNGANGVAADHAYFARLEYSFGEGAADAEGALGAGDGLAATLGVSYANFDDLSGTMGDDMMWAIDFWGTSGPIGFGFEYASVDDGIAATTDEDFSSAIAGLVFTPDSNPWGITGSFLLNEEFEIGLRYEDTDNSDDTTAVTLGLNYYQSGHNAKWQASVTDIDSDTIVDGTVWAVGLVLGSSGTM